MLSFHSMKNLLLFSLILVRIFQFNMLFVAFHLLVLGTLVDQSMACFGLNPSACGRAADRDVSHKSLCTFIFVENYITWRFFKSIWNIGRRRVSTLDIWSVFWRWTNLSRWALWWKQHYWDNWNPISNNASGKSWFCPPWEPNIPLGWIDELWRTLQLLVLWTWPMLR